MLYISSATDAGYRCKFRPTAYLDGSFRERRMVLIECGLCLFDQNNLQGPFYIIPYQLGRSDCLHCPFAFLSDSSGVIMLCLFAGAQLTSCRAVLVFWSWAIAGCPMRWFSAIPVVVERAFVASFWSQAIAKRGRVA